MSDLMHIKEIVPSVLEGIKERRESYESGKGITEEGTDDQYKDIRIEE